MMGSSAKVSEFSKQYKENRQSHWNAVARKKDNGKRWGNYYHKITTKVYKFLIPPDKRILEIGCGVGDLLSSLKPSYGVGIDFSSEKIRQAKEKYPDLNFFCCDAHEMDLKETFDYIILSDIIDDLDNVYKVFTNVMTMTTSDTRLITNFYSHLWKQPLRVTAYLGLSTPLLPQNWLTVEDVSNLLYLADFEVIKQWEEFLWPLETPFLAPLFNTILVRFPPFKIFALTNFIVARPKPKQNAKTIKPTVSVIVPARNESDNIPQIIMRIPTMGSKMEVIFVEGHSQDNTYNVIKKAIKEHHSFDCKLFRQPGDGKGDAVRFGFSHATGEILMILDADLSVSPEELLVFYNVIECGKAELVNGVRLVYPMDKKAMRFFNLLGNKFFSIVFTWLLGQPIRDTLCGTKVISKYNYEKIVENRSYFGDFDPFGDFDLIFGAAKLNLKIVDLPVRYKERSYGSTNIRRFKHGWLLLKMAFFAAKKIKFN